VVLDEILWVMFGAFRDFGKLIVVNLKLSCNAQLR
jgi:hypothetical protein